MGEKELVKRCQKGGLHGLSNEALASEAKRETIVVNEVPEGFDAKKGLTD